MNDRKCYGLGGCGLSSEQNNTATDFKVGRSGNFSLTVNIVTPYMPIVTDGKAPDLVPIRPVLRGVLEKAVQRFRRQSKTNLTGTPTQKAVVLERLDEAVKKTSGGGKYRYSLRQLFYCIVPHY